MLEIGAAETLRTWIRRAEVTGTGRVVAVALMIGGISLVGIVTATLAFWIVQRVAEEDTANQAATIAHIEELRAEIRQLAKSGIDSADNGQPLVDPPREHSP